MSVIHIASSPIKDSGGVEGERGGRQYCRRCGALLIDTAGRDLLAGDGGPVFFAAGQLVEEMPGGLAGTRLVLLRDRDHYCLSQSRKLAQREDTDERGHGRKRTRMRIEVTEDDIRRGLVGDCRFCPVAIALARVHGIRPGENGAVSVREGSLYVWREDQARSLRMPYAMPSIVAAFVRDFDEGLTVLPFDFELPDAPDYG